MIAVVGCVFSLITLSYPFGDFYEKLSDQYCWRCPSYYVPVCTNNQLTFTNECRVKCYNDALRRLNKTLETVAYYGTCVSTFVQVGVQVPADMNTNFEYGD